MKREWCRALLLTGLFLACLSVSAVSSAAQEGPLRDEQPPIPIAEIIERFAAKETQFGEARSNYVYRQEVTVQELDGRDRVAGEYHIISDLGFDPDGIRRTEEILYAPPSTLQRISLSPQDMQDIREIQPFVLTTVSLPLYDIEYIGKQKIDEIDNYVFDLGPRQIEEGERYFEGRIWVDDLDLQIVKTYGKAVPDIRDGDEENLFPRFETYRQQIDGYWFPTYTRAVDTLNFSSGPVRIRQVIRYDNYRRFQSDVRLSFDDEVAVEDEGPGAGPPEPPAQ